MSVNHHELVGTTRHLTTLMPVTVAGNTVNPHDFFKTREGLRTSDDFEDLILSGASKEMVSVDKTIIGFADLEQAANDEKIADELPDGYDFRYVDACLVQVATLIEDYWGSKGGSHFDNGSLNIFYVEVKAEVFAVYVVRDAVGREWYCNTYRLDDLPWGAGWRVFSATVA